METVFIAVHSWIVYIFCSGFISLALGIIGFLNPVTLPSFNKKVESFISGVFSVMIVGGFIILMIGLILFGIFSST